MPGTRRLMQGEVTYSWAKEKETNILAALERPIKTDNFISDLCGSSALIRQAAAHHLGVSIDECEIDDEKNWLRGSFNVCVPIIVGTERYLMRFSQLHRVGESFRPGNADEKLRCEAGTYSWLQDSCPSVSIPKLYGFALSTGQSFTAIDSLPLLPRYLQYFRRWTLNLLGYPLPPRYHRRTGPCLEGLPTGYLLIEYIDDSKGTMLSCSWDNNKHKKGLITNLFRSLSKILLAIAQVPLPRIGSFIINNDGFLTLSNRPLSIEIQELEDEDIPTDIPRSVTYSSVYSYVLDMLAFHDNRLEHQPNAANDRFHCIFQISALTMMRTIASHFFTRELRHGPFVYILNDLHQSNILVDKYWNIKYIIDLEWACSRPIEMLHPPRWFAGQAVDEIDVDEYGLLRREFMSVLEEEESLSDSPGTMALSTIMNQGWESKTFWYSLALQSPSGVFAIFYDHLRSIFAGNGKQDGHFYRVAKQYWRVGVEDFVARKVKDKAAYDLKLKEEFGICASP